MMVALTRDRMYPSLRIATRIARRKAIRQGDWDTAKCLRRALRDWDIMAELSERLLDTHGEEMSALAIGDGTFLDWLIENWDKILKMIMDIIGLFP